MYASDKKGSFHKGYEIGIKYRNFKFSHFDQTGFEIMSSKHFGHYRHKPTVF